MPLRPLPVDRGASPGLPGADCRRAPGSRWPRSRGTIGRRPLRLALAGLLAAATLSPLAGRALEPVIELTVEAELAGGEGGDSAPLVLQPGDRLLSGDRVRIRVQARDDLRPVVVAIGSSGAVRLLHPYRPGEGSTGGAQVVIPDEARALPLDDTPGVERIVAVGLPARAGSPESVREAIERIVRSGRDPASAIRERFPASALLRFEHRERGGERRLAALRAGWRPPVASPARPEKGGPEGGAAVPGGPSGSAVPREPGVLEGAGSRIRALLGASGSGASTGKRSAPGRERVRLPPLPPRASPTPSRPYPADPDFPPDPAGSLPPRRPWARHLG